MTPKKGRLLRSVIMIAGLLLMILGLSNVPLQMIGLIVMISGFIPDLLYNRCPYCGKWLKRFDGEYCPYCGNRVEP